MALLKPILVLILALNVSSCGILDDDGSDSKKKDDPKSKEEKKDNKEKPAGDQDGFNLAASQTCGKNPAGDLPEDPTTTSGIDIKEVQNLLESNELEGWIHGAAHKFGHYVFTYRGESFFKHIELSMIPTTKDLVRTFGELQRHDKIRIGGFFANNRSPLKHLMITQLEVIEPFEEESTRPYAYNADIDKELSEASYMYGKVHAVSLDGAVAVLEYRDAIVPLFVNKQHRDQTKGLYRNDIVKVQITTKSVPNRPLHVATAPSKKSAVELVDRMVYCHNKKTTLVGQLVYFPKSPQLNFPIFALRHEDGNGIVRNWTLVNFTDPDVFTAIREKLDAKWQEQLESANPSRNNMLNTKVIVTAKGTMNVVSPNQANPQILLDGPDDITFKIIE